MSYNMPGYGGGYGPPQGPPPPNHLVWAILSTIFCCLPLGVVAIVFAAQVNSKAAAGDYAGAQSASNSAKTWAMVSTILGAIATVLWVIVYAAALSNSS
ncbi:CD225/dispanin family protein [Actinomadura barringtoniae]|uniref:CD225/dispanin family protein n=1 Tax=Actinomadura barringtoniae TaxID=1427535 RepID=A0A939PE69_9ACTN|nr:CD225/dispanin family protein [Actinomadura barringtoniae]MBO2450975.1 CD225/dispanin family protein [Actinomadura barringtoniae]